MSLTEKLPEIEVEDARELLRKYWDMQAEVEPLSSERDLNMVVEDHDGARFLLKISHPDEEYGISNLQTEALLHIARRDPALPVPQLIATTRGDFETYTTLADGRTSMIRLFSYLPGEQVGLSEITDEMAMKLGKVAARLDMALADLEHPYGEHGLLWNTSRLEVLAPYVEHIPDPEKRRIIEKNVQLLCQDILPGAAEMPSQLIHNDLNLGNVLFDNGSVSGIVDFGDMLHCQRVIDPANLAAYLTLDSEDPFRISRVAAEEYSAVNALSDRERELLPYLVLGRSLVTILITNWRASLMPEQASRILRHEPQAYNVVRRVETADVRLQKLFWEGAHV